MAEKGGVYNVCDSYQPSFGEISISVAKQLGKRKPLSIPYWMAWCMAKVGDLLGSKAPINSYKLEKMTKSLTFSNEKARRELGWEPLDVLVNGTLIAHGEVVVVNDKFGIRLTDVISQVERIKKLQ